MIVFTTVDCSRVDKVLATGFDKRVEGRIGHHAAGRKHIFCTEVPLASGVTRDYEIRNNVLHLPPGWHVALPLDVPDDVLSKYALVAKPVNDRTGEHSWPMGWLLPVKIANKYRPSFGVIDVGCSTGRATAALDWLEETPAEEITGYWSSIAAAIRRGPATARDSRKRRSTARSSQ
jgi:hypothetical protein